MGFFHGLPKLPAARPDPSDRVRRDLEHLRLGVRGQLAGLGRRERAGHALLHHPAPGQLKLDLDGLGDLRPGRVGQEQHAGLARLRVSGHARQQREQKEPCRQAPPQGASSSANACATARTGELGARAPLSANSSRASCLCPS